jgi:hypothetical protein
MDDKPVTRQGGSVYLIIQKGVTITLTPPDRANIFFLDISLGEIESFSMHESKLPVQTQATRRLKGHAQPDIKITGLTLILKPRAKFGNCLLNTKPKNMRSIVLTSIDAEIIREAIATLEADLGSSLGKPHRFGSSQSIESGNGSTFRVGGSQSININCSADEKTGELGSFPVLEPAGSELPIPVHKVQTVGKLATLFRALSAEPVQPARKMLHVVSQNRGSPVAETLFVASIGKEQGSTEFAKSLGKGVTTNQSDGVGAKIRHISGKEKKDVDVYEFVASEEDEVKIQSKKIKKRKGCLPARSQKPAKTTPKGVAKKVQSAANRRERKVEAEEDSEEEFKNKHKSQTLSVRLPRTRAQAKRVADSYLGQETKPARKQTPGGAQPKTENSEKSPEAMVDFQNAQCKQDQQADRANKFVKRMPRVVPDSNKQTDHYVVECPVVVPGNDKPVGLKLEPGVMEGVQSAPAIVKELTKAKPGSSQTAPIAISSDKESSVTSDEEVDIIENSYHPSTSPPARLAVEDSTKSFALPPPRVRLVTSSELIDDMSARKMSIVSFGRTGPQNQGFTPGVHQVSHAHPESETPVESVEQKRKPRQSHASRKHETQPTQPWYSRVEQLSDAVKDGIVTPNEHILPSTKRRKIKRELQSNVDWPDIDDVLDQPISFNKSQNGQRTVGSSVKESICVRGGSVASASKPPAHRRQVDHAVSLDVAPTDNEFWSKKSSQVSQRNVRISKDGSPILVDLRKRYRVDRERGFGQMDEEENELLQHVHSQCHSHRISSMDEARNAHIMSSNRKAAPHSPEAGSQAISGHAPAHAVQEALARSQHLNISNPFERAGQSSGGNPAFVQKLWRIVASKSNAMPDMELTLVEDERRCDGTSDSSDTYDDETMDVDEEKSGPSAEDIAWEESILPRHRNLVDVLGRITRRLVGHLIDSETAIDDIIEDYTTDGEFLINELEKAHRDKCERLINKFHDSTHQIVGEYRHSLRKISTDQRMISNSVGNGLTYWRQGQDTQKSHIKRLERFPQNG